MTVRPRALAVALFTILALAGCAPARAAGTDGDLVDDWAAGAAPAYVISKAGDCLKGDPRAAYDTTWHRTLPVDCAEEHTLDVVSVIDLPDAPAAPAWDSDASRAAHAACATAVNDHVGGDWHDGALGVHVLLPTALPWKGGASWCCPRPRR